MVDKILPSKQIEDVDIKLVKIGDPEMKDCLDLEYKVFLSEGYIEPNDEKRIVDYNDYPNYEMIRAKAKLVNDDQYKLVGMWRLIYANPDETIMKKGIFPTLDSPEELPIYDKCMKEIQTFNPQEGVDLASASILKPYRNRVIADALLFEGVVNRVLSQPQLTFWLGAPDTQWLDRITKREYLPVEVIGDSNMYWGSYCNPILTRMDDLRNMMEK